MAKCPTCGRTRCICERTFDVVGRLGPPEPVPGLPEVPPLRGEPRRFRPSESGLLSKPRHHGCLNGCNLCTPKHIDARLAYALRAIDKEAYNKFGSVDDGQEPDEVLD